MSTLEEMIRSGRPATPIQFRAKPYGSEGEAEFLRDLLAIANADVKGARLIVVGVDPTASGPGRVPGVDPADFARQAAYVDLAKQFIEPAIEVNYVPAKHGEVHVGIFRIGACLNRPYRMGADHSPELVRGEAWVRVNDERKILKRPDPTPLPVVANDGVAPGQVEVGFVGGMTHQRISLPVCDLSQLPSVLAAGKIRQLLMTQKQASGTGNTTMMVRLTHARLFGDASSYQPQTPEAMAEQMRRITLRHRADDRRFMFEKNGGELQVRVFNQSAKAIEAAAMTLSLPNLSGLYVARDPADEDYPQVDINEDVAVVTVKLGPIAPGTACSVFKKPVKLCAGQGLDGQRLAIRYRLTGPNLSAPVEGVLEVNFSDQLEALMA